VPKKSQPTLTLKQERFVTAYLGEAHGNATLAAKVAGYAGNDVTLSSVAVENLRKPLIRRLVDERLEAEVPSSAVILRELAQIGLSPVLYGIAGNVLEPQAVQAKLKALELLGKYHALFVDVTKGIEIPKTERELDEALVREWRRVKGGDGRSEPIH
jgi:hypothetical protein